MAKTEPKAAEAKEEVKQVAGTEAVAKEVKTEVASAKTEPKAAEAKEEVKQVAGTEAVAKEVKTEVASAKTEPKAAEAKVFYIAGYGNVNGCKSQAEAEEKAVQIKKKIRE